MGIYTPPCDGTGTHCLHDLPWEQQGQICCFCGDIFQLRDAPHDGHGDFVPKNNADDLEPDPIEIQQEMEFWCGVRLTVAQVNEILALNPEIWDNLQDMGEWETAMRESFIDAMGRWVGQTRQWPSFSETANDSREYFRTFAEAARNKGIELDGAKWSQLIL